MPTSWFSRQFRNCMFRNRSRATMTLSSADICTIDHDDFCPCLEVTHANVSTKGAIHDQLYMLFCPQALRSDRTISLPRARV